jgi:hypothetical protein
MHGSQTDEDENWHFPYPLFAFSLCVQVLEDTLNVLECQRSLKFKFLVCV